MPRWPNEPTEYQEVFAKQAAKLCKFGATDADLADFFECSRTLIYSWQLKHKPFSKAMAMGKAQADNRVERSLFQRAVGYSHEIDDIRVVEGKVVVTPTMKHYPPDTTACIYWTKNRDPQNWRDKRDFDYRGNVAIAAIKIEIVDPKEKEVRITQTRRIEHSDPEDVPPVIDTQ